MRSGRIFRRANTGFVFSLTGTVCDEWEYYRGICPRNIELESSTNPAAVFSLSRNDVYTLREIPEGGPGSYLRPREGKSVMSRPPSREHATRRQHRYSDPRYVFFSLGTMGETSEKKREYLLPAPSG
jgi:hypothetical protein